MKKMIPFREEYTFQERLDESKNIIAKYPDRVPIIAERFARSDLPDMEKKKYLVPRDMSVGQFIHILTRRLHLAPGKALFVFVNNTLPQTSIFSSVRTNFSHPLIVTNHFLSSQSRGIGLRILQKRRRVLVHVLQQREGIRWKSSLVI
ncbi:Autophagy-related protein 8i [Platanthera zijinensis]|uniref:Autophagy-related protein n=1 Tax=Platanthera zijinensis TaxID=2320716 RepID=A0AAP0BY24_9ASPA